MGAADGAVLGDSEVKGQGAAPGAAEGAGDSVGAGFEAVAWVAATTATKRTARTRNLKEAILLLGLEWRERKYENERIGVGRGTHVEGVIYSFRRNKLK